MPSVPTGGSYGYGFRSDLVPATAVSTEAISDAELSSLDGVRAEGITVAEQVSLDVVPELVAVDSLLEEIEEGGDDSAAGGVADTSVVMSGPVGQEVSAEYSGPMTRSRARRQEAESSHVDRIRRGAVSVVSCSRGLFADGWVGTITDAKQFDELELKFGPMFDDNLVSGSSDTPSVLAINRLSKDVPPRNFRSAMAMGFENAMRKEEESLIFHKVYEPVTHVPPGEKIIPAIWVHTYKPTSSKNVVEKSRIVARGDLQVTDGGNFSPTTDRVMVRLLLALAMEKGLDVGFADFSNAFLNGKLEKPVYVKSPNLVKNGGGTELWKVTGNLYGLAEAPVTWYKKLVQIMEFEGLYEINRGWCMFKNEKLIVQAYVDDLLVIGKKEDIIHLYDRLDKQYRLTHCVAKEGECHRFLGMNISFGPELVALDMQLNVQELVDLMKEYTKGKVLKNFVKFPVERVSHSSETLDGLPD